MSSPRLPTGHSGERQDIQSCTVHCIDLLAAFLVRIELSILSKKHNLQPLTRTRNREELATSHKNHFACFGCGKVEEVLRVCEDARLIFTMQTRGSKPIFFSLESSKLYPPPPTTLRLLHIYYSKCSSKKLIIFGNIIYMFVTHSFSTRAAGLFLVLMTHTQSFSISCSNCQSILWIVKAVSCVF